jgi:hypothetical protein
MFPRYHFCGLTLNSTTPKNDRMAKVDSRARQAAAEFSNEVEDGAHFPDTT